ncbi:ABC transporter permease subunit [Prosthecochloris sp. ZM_2]|uniref:molybdate ABC transporter permease subunit n=1 Tax=Prosthecochloris sp. ZM_2 TaxID=2045206 RepID=UPI000DF826B6|nr:ABC transporter permease subunit [Prosthecochloris sp. ZM_2]RNA64562.1 ABC transporter permease subunit [Prosthecochloris sp. ZM_2]
MHQALQTVIQPETLAPLLLSLKTALAALVSHLILGVGLGYALSLRKLPFRFLLDAIVTLPLVFPPIATGFMLLMLFGRYGLIGEHLASHGIDIVFSPAGVYIAAVISGLPLVVKPVQSAIENTTGSLREAARTLGKSELNTLVCIILPNIRSVILAGLLLSVGRSFGEVGITLMLGGNITRRTETVSLAIYNAVFEGNFEKALLLSALLAIISVAVFTGMNKLNGHSKTAE